MINDKRCCFYKYLKSPHSYKSSNDAFVMWFVKMFLYVLQISWLVVYYEDPYLCVTYSYFSYLSVFRFNIMNIWNYIFKSSIRLHLMTQVLANLRPFIDIMVALANTSTPSIKQSIPYRDESCLQILRILCKSYLPTKGPNNHYWLLYLEKSNR